MSPRATHTILVTGGAGFVGSHFVRHAHDVGRRLVVLDDLSGGAPAPMPPGVDLIVGDIGDRAKVGELVRARDVGAVVHFAGKIQVGESVKDPATYFDVNLCRTLALLDVVRDCGVRAFLFSSTAAVYGNPDEVPIPETARLEPVNPYGATKLGVEHALAAWEGAYGLAWGALRYFNASGAEPDGSLREMHDPETHLIPLVLDAGLGRRPPITIFGTDYDTPDGTCIRDYIHVVDLATAHLAALERVEAGVTVGPVNLGTGSGYSVREVIVAAGAALGRPVPTTIGDRRPGDPARLIADPSRALDRLAWRARRSDLPTILADALRSRRAA